MTSRGASRRAVKSDSAALRAAQCAIFSAAQIRKKHGDGLILRAGLRRLGIQRGDIFSQT